MSSLTETTGFISPHIATGPAAGADVAAGGFEGEHAEPIRPSPIKAVQSLSQVLRYGELDISQQDTCCAPCSIEDRLNGVNPAIVKLSYVNREHVCQTSQKV